MSDEPQPQSDAGTSLWKDAWGRLVANKLSVFCAVAFAVITVACLLGPPLLTLLYFPDTAEGNAYTANTQDLELGATGPSMAHPLGTDTLGRDLLLRVLVGGRLSLAVGLVATIVALIIGVTYGALAGYLGGKIDTLMMRVVDILYAFPFLLFVILLSTVFKSSLILLFAAIGCVEWLTMARIVRGQVASLKTQEFVEAAEALRVSTPVILARHLVPNVLGPVIVYATLTVPAVMLFEATLSFLGLGVQPPHASWGVLINEGAKVMSVFPWLLLFPALLFSLTLFSLNLVGDGLRDALDPKSGHKV